MNLPTQLNQNKATSYGVLTISTSFISIALFLKNIRLKYKGFIPPTVVANIGITMPYVPFIWLNMGD